GEVPNGGELGPDGRESRGLVARDPVAKDVVELPRVCDQVVVLPKRQGRQIVLKPLDIFPTLGHQRVPAWPPRRIRTSPVLEQERSSLHRGQERHTVHREGVLDRKST